jgi:tRNA wybutosine-synthesizing protein 2
LLGGVLYNRQSAAGMAPLKPSKFTGGCLTHPEGLACARLKRGRRRVVWLLTAWALPVHFVGWRKITPTERTYVLQTTTNLQLSTFNPSTFSLQPSTLVSLTFKPTSHMPDTRIQPSSHLERVTRPSKAKSVAPIESAIRCWVEILPAGLLDSIQLNAQSLISSAPKRWVLYSPMVLLPSASFGDTSWSVTTSSLEQGHRDELWRLILRNIGKREGKGALTHLAVNSGIPLRNAANEEYSNFLRTPSGLVMLYGNFGPSLNPDRQPSQKDFEEAFWVSTKQNGIIQVWAPRYTMFSRGNVTEKQRILDFHGPKRERESRERSRSELGDETAIDLYAGIGYFVFSYASMGMGRILGWELNPWSVEGLRRGASSNGWTVKTVRAEERLELGDEKIIVMSEDNRKAGKRLEGVTGLGSISHINCGLLPSSEASWEMALNILSGNGWLHLHENVGVGDILTRGIEIEGIVQATVREQGDGREVKLEHVETVKSFAPGVFHIVYDVYVGCS